MEQREFVTGNIFTLNVVGGFLEGIVSREKWESLP